MPQSAMEGLNLRHNYERLNDPEGISNDIVECTIQQIGVWEDGYQALSYVWGSEGKPFYALVRDAKGDWLGQIPSRKT
jgi:hypothetical protein